jgi:serine/threonine protein kinase
MVQTVSFSIKVSSLQESASQRLETKVNYFHLKNILIKRSFTNYFRNILIKNNNLKIVDFCMLKFLVSTETIITLGTPAYHSPEIKLNKRGDFKSDIW